MTCARRPAGARTPASPTSAGSPSRPDPRTGRPRARRFRLLPVLALLLGALGLFAPAPAEAAHSLATPTNLQAQAGDAQVTLTWSGIANHRGGYTVAHGEHPSGTLSTQTVAVSANRTVTITGLTNDTTYRFRVQARGHSGHTASAWTSFVTATPTAQTSSTPIWSATLTADQDGNDYGCSENLLSQDNCSTALTDNDFTISGTTFRIDDIIGGNTTLSVTFNRDVQTSLDSYSFCVGATALAFSDAQHSSGFSASWTTTAASGWSDGDTVALSIGTSCAQQTTPTTPAAPTNLASLAGDGSLYFEWTAPSGTLTGYDVHYTSAPTSGNGAVTNDAAVQTASAAAGWLAVSRSGTDDYQEITGLTNGRLYRVRVRAINASGAGAWAFGTGTPEALVPPSNLVVTPGDAELRVSWTAATGTFAGYDLDITSAAVGDVANDAATGSNLATAWVLAANPISSATSYTIDSDDATLVNGVTYRVRLRTASPESAYTYGMGTPQAQTSSTPIWSATLTVKQAAASLGCLNALSNVECSSTSVLTDDDFTVSSTDWAITGITSNSTELSVQFSRNVQTALDSYSFCVGTTALAFSSASHTSNDSATWSTTVASGWSADDTVSLSIGTSCAGSTPAKTFKFSPDAYVVPPGTAFNLIVKLSVPAPDGGLEFTLTQLLSNSVPADLCDGSEVKATAEDIGANPPTTLTVQAGQTEGRVFYPSADNGDDRVGGIRECLAVRASTATSGWAAAADGTDTAELTISVGPSGLLSFGQSAANDQVPRYAETVSEGAGTVSVPVTVSYLPSSSKTFAVEVVTGQNGGTATEYVDAQNPGDFRIASKSVTFDTSDTSRTKNLSVTINDDSDMEAGETIVLRLADASANSYARLTNGQYATLTIQDNEGPPLETVVTGNMTVGDGGSWKGFRANPSVGSLSGADFKLGGVDYRILGLRLTNSGGFLILHLNKGVDRKWGLVLVVGGTRFPLADAALFTGNYEGVMASWGYGNLPGSPTPPSWRVGQTVPVSLGEPAPAAVKLSVRPNPVNEGSSASVEACLPALPQQGRTVRIPVKLSHGGASDEALANPSEDGDWGVSLTGDTDGRLPIRTTESIAISGWLQRACGTVNIPTHRDSDDDDETFTVKLDTDNLPPGVQAGSPAKVKVTIRDLSNWPEVTLRAVRRTVAEGSPVELQAVLTKPLATDVVIPLRVRGITSETADHGFIRSITIAAGATSGSGTIRTSRDDDTDDERFQVGVIQPELPSGVAPGSPSTVGITIADGANARLRALDLNAGN